MSRHLDGLHAEVALLNIKDWHVEAIVHALIDLRRVAVVECQADLCAMDSRAFKPRAGGRGNSEPYKLHVDHIVPQSLGGSHRTGNLRIVHSRCNIVSQPREMTPERRANHAAGRKRFLESGDKTTWLEAMRNRKPGWNKKQRSDDRRGGRPDG